MNASCMGKMSRQTGQTQIRLLLKKQSGLGLPCLLNRALRAYNIQTIRLKKQSDQGLPCLLLWQTFFVNSSPDNQHFNCELKDKSFWNFRAFTLVSLFVVTLSTLQFSLFITHLIIIFCVFVWFDSLPHSQQFFSYVGTGLPGLNEY